MCRTNRRHRCPQLVRELIELTYDSVHIEVKVLAGVDLSSIAVCQIFQVRRQVFLKRHHGAPHEDWNYSYPQGQGGLNFDPHKIIRLVETPSAVRLHLQPISANYGEQHVTLIDGISEMLPKVGAVG